VTSEDDPLRAPLRLRDDAPQVLDRDAHSPLARVADVVVGDQREVVGDARVGEPAEVVVEQLETGRSPFLRAVEHRVILELVLSPLDRPDLPASHPRDHGPRERREVGGAGRGPRDEDQDVPGVLGPDLEHTDAVELGGSSG
jgi:hypothetical protein